MLSDCVDGAEVSLGLAQNYSASFCLWGGGLLVSFLQHQALYSAHWNYHLRQQIGVCILACNGTCAIAIYHNSIVLN